MKEKIYHKISSSHEYLSENYTQISREKGRGGGVFLLLTAVSALFFLFPFKLKNQDEKRGGGDMKRRKFPSIKITCDRCTHLLFISRFILVEVNKRRKLFFSTLFFWSRFCLFFPKFVTFIIRIIDFMLEFQIYCFYLLNA